MQVGWGVLDAPQREGLDRAIGTGHAPIDQAGLVEPFGPEVVHEIVRVIRGHVAGGALGFAKEQLLSTLFRVGGFWGVQLAQHRELGGGGEVEQFLEFRHEVHLAPALQGVDPLFRGNHGIPIEVGGSLLELGEVFDAAQRPLRAEQPLDMHSPQGRGIDTVTERLGPDVADEMGGGIRVAIRVTFKTDHPPTRPFRPAVFGLVELLLGERRHQQSQSLQLLGVEDAVEQLEEVLYGHQLPLGDIAPGPAGW